MFLITTRNFPPDVGGMQFLMFGIAKNLVRHGPVQVFADDFKIIPSFSGIELDTIFSMYAFNWFDENKDKIRGRQVEINNGRLAMLGIMELITHDIATQGSESLFTVHHF